MNLGYKHDIISYCTVLLLVLVQQTHQYLYSCDPTVSCGCSPNSATVSRIVGGETAATSTWSWAVSISINNQALCGGSVISSSWVITAAHCVSGLAASKVTVYAGSNARFSGQSRVASSITVHPSYVSSTHVNDIALIRLSSPLTISNSSVKPVCIPSVDSATLSAGEWPAAGLSVVAIGWGTLTEDGSLPYYLQQVTVETIAYTDPTCYSVLYNQQKQLCAGVYGGGKDTCQGDSGGPLMMFTTSNQWVLVGLTSYGDGCARANAMGVYTRVAAYQDWIQQTTSGAYLNPASSVSARINPNVSSSAITDTTDNAVPVSPVAFLICLLLFVVFYFI
ncbi:unnamed protein product [Adineta ricciae]|uniref:Peptidase S1 domain-containing protein n=1 Tax=Adineta ricciae TaxID=249248 RepID=A0A813ZYK2_ADIRI|nr:unnamed protein product [Adineta ricciae]CAF1414477.1 unnamed protein product [Adineta ricciae]